MISKFFDIFKRVSIEILLLKNSKKNNNRISIDYKNFKCVKLSSEFHAIKILIFVFPSDFLKKLALCKT